MRGLFWTEKPFLLRIIRVKKRIVILVLKYGLGPALLAFVVWTYWVIKGSAIRA